MVSKQEKEHGEEMLKCPRCNIRMLKIKRKKVILDICKKCGGMWLDKGEMEKLVDIGKHLEKGDPAQS